LLASEHTRPAFGMLGHLPAHFRDQHMVSLDIKGQQYIGFLHTSKSILCSPAQKLPTSV